MAYCTNAQVAEEFSGVTFSSTTNPTDTTVDRWIAEADQIIDSKVGLRYNVPVDESTHPNAWLIVRNISIMLVSSRVRKRLNRSGPNGDTAKKVIDETYKDAMRMLKDISEGKLALSELTPINTDLGISSFNVDNNKEYTFKKDIDQW